MAVLLVCSLSLSLPLLLPRTFPKVELSVISQFSYSLANSAQMFSWLERKLPLEPFSQFLFFFEFCLFFPLFSSLSFSFSLKVQSQGIFVRSSTPSSLPLFLHFPSVNFPLFAVSWLFCLAQRSAERTLGKWRFREKNRKEGLLPRVRGPSSCLAFIPFAFASVQPRPFFFCMCSRIFSLCDLTFLCIFISFLSVRNIFPVLRFCSISLPVCGVF